MNNCTHTSGWWKEMTPCSVCGAPYSYEEAERLAKDKHDNLDGHCYSGCPCLLEIEAEGRTA